MQGTQLEAKDSVWTLLYRLDRVFEAIVRNCSFVARRMPEETLIEQFNSTYGNGPDRPSFVIEA